MGAKNGPEELQPEPPQPESGVYIDSSALAKVYMPEPESELLEGFLLGRRDLIISELSVTEVVSAAARRMREGALDAKRANEIRKALLDDSRSGYFRRIDISPGIHREAERMLLSAQSVPLRTLDALHIALALSAEARSVVTFDSRMAEAAELYGLATVAIT